MCLACTLATTANCRGCNKPLCKHHIERQTLWRDTEVIDSWCKKCFPHSRKIDYDQLMSFLVVQDLCCTINSAAFVFGKKICWDCFHKVRPAITDIYISWDESALTHIIDWID